MSGYSGRHRKEDRLSRADSGEIDRILAMKAAPLRTIEEIAADVEQPGWVKPIEEHGKYNPVPPPPLLTFRGPPVWRIRDWVQWIKSWRLYEQNDEDRYRLV